MRQRSSPRACSALLALPAALAMLSPGPAWGQGTSLGIEVVAPPGEQQVLILEERAEEDRAEAAAMRAEQAAIERELRILRRQFFGSRNDEIRQIGIAELRRYNEPRYFPALIEVFEHDRMDVREAIFDMLAEHASGEGDAALAWAAIFDDEEPVRHEAFKRLAERTETEGGASARVKAVIVEALDRPGDVAPARAAEIAQQLRIADMIPYLIAAQAQQPRSESARTGDLANIVIGRQIAFVSDLQPVVADGAVGFDPELSVVTEGVVLGISDAVVTIYRPAVHRSLVRLTSDLWGQSTRHFAYDAAQWNRWYQHEFRPFWREQLRTSARSNG